MANASDTAGVKGAIHCQVLENDAARVFTSRGVRLLDGTADPGGDEFRKVGALQGPGGNGIALEFLVDFDAGTITWTCRNLQTEKQFGPRTIRYSGTFKGLDCLNFWICGPGTQLDDFRIQNH